MNHFTITLSPRLAAAALFSLTIPVLAAETLDESSAPALTELSLDQLSQLRIVTPTKLPGRLQTTPAAAFVITQDDIRRSGVTTLMDALRLAPGVHVAQVNTDMWAISIRGFNKALADKVLVMIDGRSIYTPLFSNVFWREHDLPLEDIERIEVIRGPGGTIWGANAVNGIINIVTKSAVQTQGGLLAVHAGDKEGSVNARYGEALGQNAHYRITGKLTWLF